MNSLFYRLQKIKSQCQSQRRSDFHSLERLSVEWLLFSRQFPAAAKLILELHRQHLTYCSKTKLMNLFHAIQEISKEKIPGIFIEAGCGLGGSAILIAKHKPAEQPFFIYDVFTMIPAPGSQDGKDAHQRYEQIKEGGGRRELGKISTTVTKKN